MSQESESTTRVSLVTRRESPVDGGQFLPAPAGRVAEAPLAPAAGEFKPLQFVHSMLRGRYFLVVPLGLIFGAFAGYLAWRSTRPIYQSEALVQIAYALPSIDGGDNGRTLPMYNTFMASQKTLITSRRAIDMAIADRIWTVTGRQVPVNPEQYFASNLLVDIKAGSEFIRIVVSDTDPGTAATAVNAIVNAYEELYKKEEQRRESAQRGVLEDTQRTLQSQIKDLTARITVASQEYGTSKLDVFYEAAAARLNKLDSALFDLRVALATASASATQPATAPSTQPADCAQDRRRVDDLPIEHIAGLDPTTRRHYEQVEKLQEEIDTLLSRGLGEAHTQVIGKREELNRAKARMMRAADVYRQIAAIVGPGGVDHKSGFTGLSHETLLNNQASLAKLRERAEKEMLKLGNKRLELQRMDADLESLRKELDRTEDALKSLQKAKGVGSRLTVISTGEVPLSPAKDRRLVFAAGGGAVGSMLPVLLFIGIGLIGRRYRYSDETEAYAAGKNIPLLGILPELPSRNSDQGELLAASYSIHHIRVSLHARASALGWKTFLLTSSAASEGKTSITVSLGCSFAAAHLRTVLIDADLIGRNLTEYFNARRAQGLHEAVMNGDVLGLIRSSEVHPNLFVLPAGNAISRDACALPVAELQRLLATVRDSFDIVLIDTGPILGSIEAAVLAPQVDGVVFVITQGQNRRMVDQATRRLASLGSNLAGFVFNRATPRDFERSAFGSSSRTTLTSNPATLDAETAFAASGLRRGAADSNS